MKYLYPPIVASSTRLVSGRLGASAMTNCYVHERSELPLHALERRAQQFTARDDDDIDRRRNTSDAEDLAHTPLRPIAVHGPADLLAGRDAEPRSESWRR